MYKVEILPAAQRDMLEIVKYVSEKLQNPIAAENLAEKLIAGIEALGGSPHIYPVHHPLKALSHEYRKKLCENYLVFYWVNEPEKTVTVARVIYAKREYGKELK